MRIGVIQASSQAGKNALIYDAVRKYAPEGARIINFGCTKEEDNRYSYVEISVLIGLLISGGAVDFIVTGCSSGQGMMLACNSMPGVICGYAPTPKDAYLFCQINNGNALSLPVGEEYTWAGSDNMEKTIMTAFSEPFGQGYPKSESARKLIDTELLKKIRRQSQILMPDLIDKLDTSLVNNIMKKDDVIDFIMKNGDGGISEWIRRTKESVNTQRNEI